MTATHKLKSEAEQEPMVALLNELLAGTLDLGLRVKQAHWNVRGENFIALHELFDRIAKEVGDYADLLAERAVQLDGLALGTLQDVAKRTNLVAYPVNIRDGGQHVKELSAAMDVLTESLRRSIDVASDNDDAVTVDLLTEITRGLDKSYWILKSHLNA